MTLSTVRPRGIAIAGIVLATLIAYFPVLSDGGFIWDDDDYVTDNAVLVAEDALTRIWQPGETPQYYPLVFTSFWVELQLWGLDPTGYHIINVLLHIANALLVWRLCSMIGIRGGWLIAALFALHPVHVESVAWITERKNVLSGLFYLLAGMCYLHFMRRCDERPLKESLGWYGGALVLFVCALLSKTVTCSLPAAIILIMLLQGRRLTLRNLAPLVPFFAVGLALAINTASIEATQVGAHGPDFQFTILERCLIASKALLFYVQKLIVPWPLMFIYPRWAIAGASVLAYWPVLVALGVAGGAIALFVRGYRGPAIGLAFFAGTALPALGFINVYPHRFSFVADHFQYLASLGVLTLIGAGWANVMSDKPRRMVGYALIPLVVFVWLTWNQSATYRNAETVWRDTLVKNPTSFMPATNLSAILMRQAAAAQSAGEVDAMTHRASEAEAFARVAIEARPGHHTALTNLSEALRLQEKFEEAIQAIEGAIASAPHLAGNYWRHGRLLELTGDPTGAMAAYREAITRAPDGATPRIDLARLLIAENRVNDAAEQHAAILEVDPDHFLALSQLARLRAEQERYAEAGPLYDRAVNAATTDADALSAFVRLTRFLATCPDQDHRDIDRALAYAERLVRNAGGADPGALALLASVLAEAGRFEDAARTVQGAIDVARAMRAEAFAAELEAARAAFASRQTWWPASDQ